MDDVKVSNKESVDAAAALTTVPKKRGRPANPDKPKKQPSGRGRGRPAKISGSSSTMKQIEVNVSEDEDCSDSSPVANGSMEMNMPSRGRPPKSGKLKLTHTIEATGKGRGRPKKTFKSDLDDEDDDDDEEGELSDYKPIKKVLGKKSVKKGRGRPKKVKDTDDDSSDAKNYDEDERRTVGRPTSGGVNLNIERTGRGQGRPKKEINAKRSSEVSNGGSSDGVPKKRGRPSTTGKNPYTPTGKPRGRPKGTSNIIDSQDEADLTTAKSENFEHSGDSHDLGINLSKYDNPVPSAEENEVHTDSDKEEND